MKYTKLDDWLSSRGFLSCFAFALAFALWFYVVGNRSDEVVKEFEVRLEFLNPPAGLSIFPSERSATVTLTGERRAMDAVQASRLVAPVDLKGLEAGEHSLPIVFKAPSKLTVSHIWPKEVELELARQMVKELKVRVLPPEDLPQGYIMDGATVVPETVKAYGREDQLSSMDEITVRPTAAELFKGGTWKTHLQAPSGMTLDFSPLEVTLSATYYQGIPRKDLPVEVRTRGSLPSNLGLVSMTLNPKTLPVEGRATDLNGVRSLHTEPINLAYVTRSRTLQTRITEIPRGLSVLAPPIISVTFEVKTLNSDKVFRDMEVHFEGASDSSQWYAEPSHVTVLAQGARDVMAAATAKSLELEAYVDLSNIVTSSVRLPVRVRFKKGVDVEIAGVEPSTVKVIRKEAP